MDNYDELYLENKSFHHYLYGKVFFCCCKLAHIYFSIYLFIKGSLLITAHIYNLYQRIPAYDNPYLQFILKDPCLWQPIFIIYIKGSLLITAHIYNLNWRIPAYYNPYLQLNLNDPCLLQPIFTIYIKGSLLITVFILKCYIINWHELHFAYNIVFIWHSNFPIISLYL